MTKNQRHRPFVFVTFAMTVDGKVTTKNLAPVDFTSRKDKLHLFRQRALADAVLIGHTSLRRDNVRLGLPAELQEARTKRGQLRCPLRVIVSNKGRIDDRLKIFQSDVSPIIIFSTKRMPRKNREALKKNPPSNRRPVRRSLADAEGTARSIQGSNSCVRRRPNPFSCLVGTGLSRSAQSYDRAVPVRRSPSSYPDRSQQGIPASQRAWLADQNAHDRRGMFSDLSNQAPAESPEVAGSLRRGRRTSSPWQFGQIKSICSAQLPQNVHS